MNLGLDNARRSRDSDVAIAGLGPVGATAALTLAKAGLQVTVFDEAAELVTDASESRASTFHPPTLEILDDLGVGERLHEVGLVSDTYQYRDRTEGLVAHFDLDSISGDTKFPYRLQSEQRNLVQIIRDRLVEMPNVRLLRGARVGSVDLGDDYAELFVEPSGEGLSSHVTGSYRARWVIGADGARSSVRRSLDLDFIGMTYPEQFLVVSTTEDFAELIPGIASVNYIADPREWLALLRTPVHWRTLSPVPPDVSGEDAMKPSQVQRSMQSIVPLARNYEIAHARLYRVHQRIAQRFRVGRVLLAGDAAHVNNPLGGMGMNSGIHDAAAAASAILAADNHDGGPIEEYDATRRAVAHDYVQVVTHQNWESLQEQDPVQRKRHYEQLRRIAADPVLAREHLLRSSMLSARPPQTATGKRNRA